jgi:hypothetical protein
MESASTKARHNAALFASDSSLSATAEKYKPKETSATREISRSAESHEMTRPNVPP